MVDHYAAKIKDFPYSMKLHIKHILLSHHGEYEYGSPKIPNTSEAYLVHLIDLMDSKMSSFEQVKKADSSTGNWSGFVKHLDRIVYKNELPTYPHYLTEEHPMRSDKTNHSKEKSNGKPTAFANLLKDIKIDD